MKTFVRLSVFTVAAILILWPFLSGGMGLLLRGIQIPDGLAKSSSFVTRTLEIKGRGQANVGYYRSSLNRTDLLNVTLPYKQDFSVNEGEYISFSVSSKESDGVIKCVLRDDKGSELSSMSSANQGTGYGNIRCFG